MNPSCTLETITGKLVDIQNPTVEMIDIESSAWGLSRLPRFCGQTIDYIPYPVAQHSIFVAKEVGLILDRLENTEDMLFADRNQILLRALLHDAAEAFTGDIPSPVKRIPELRPIIKEIEGKLQRVILEAFLGEGEYEDNSYEDIIKEADLIAQKIEAYNFMPSRGKNWAGLPDITPIKLQQFERPKSSLVVYEEFMEHFDFYTIGE
jgi:5'-deoxynucleotidase YfbR-like HD superfamily hydrolase